MSEVKHRELKIAVIDGAETQFKDDKGKWIDDYDNCASAGEIIDSYNDLLNSDVETRIKPDCKYAYRKILKLGDQSSLDKYKHWIGGGELELHTLGTAYAFNGNDPFDSFVTALRRDYSSSIKKAMKTQVLWFKVIESKNYALDIVSGTALTEYIWLDDGVQTKEPEWLKQSKTREVEA